MKKINEREYVAFILGYDLLHDEFANSSEPETDLVFEKCLEIADDFLKSEFNDEHFGLYTCVVEYLMNSSSFEKIGEKYRIAY